MMGYPVHLTNHGHPAWCSNARMTSIHCSSSWNIPPQAGWPRTNSVYHASHRRHVQTKGVVMTAMNKLHHPPGRQAHLACFWHLFRVSLRAHEETHTPWELLWIVLATNPMISLWSRISMWKAANTMYYTDNQSRMCLLQIRGCQDVVQERKYCP